METAFADPLLISILLGAICVNRGKSNEGILCFRLRIFVLFLFNAVPLFFLVNSTTIRVKFYSKVLSLVVKHDRSVSIITLRNPDRRSPLCFFISGGFEKRARHEKQHFSVERCPDGREKFSFLRTNSVLLFLLSALSLFHSLISKANGVDRMASTAFARPLPARPLTRMHHCGPSPAAMSRQRVPASPKYYNFILTHKKTARCFEISKNRLCS